MLAVLGALSIIAHRIVIYPELNFGKINSTAMQVLYAILLIIYVVSGLGLLILKNWGRVLYRLSCIGGLFLHFLLPTCMQGLFVVMIIFSFSFSI